VFLEATVLQINSPLGVSLPFIVIVLMLSTLVIIVFPAQLHTKGGIIVMFIWPNSFLPPLSQEYIDRGCWDVIFNWSNTLLFCLAFIPKSSLMGDSSVMRHKPNFVSP
jgi:hypothetical protein